MTESLLSDLTNKPQRETAGADAASRFDYQKAWAFCQMIRKHIEGEEYLVAFEFHDDVVFLSPGDAPSVAEFCQVKTSSAASPRTLSSLTSRPKKKSSILGKLMSNFDGICASHEISVVLVSNNAFQFADSDTSASDLDEKVRNKIIQKLEEEIVGFDPSRLDNLHFKVTGVSLEAMSSYMHGEAMDLFCSAFGEDHGLNVRTWIRLLQGEINRRNNHPSDQVSSAQELVEKKCIGRPFVDDTLATMNMRNRTAIDVSWVSDVLTRAGWSAADVMRMQKSIPQASTDYYNPTNNEAADLVEQMKLHLSDAEGGEKSIDVFLTEIAHAVSPPSGSVNPYAQKGYLHALGVLVYYASI